MKHVPYTGVEAVEVKLAEIDGEEKVVLVEKRPES